MLKNLNDSWKEILKEEINAESFLKLMQFLASEYENETVFPPKDQIFAAFNNVSYDDVKIVILGQDPYHNEKQANGLAFSVNKDVDCPPSLKNIFKALEYDLNIKPTKNGDLTSWTKQGVLLLNTVLSVRKNTPQSHSKKGWEEFSDGVIKKLNQRQKPMVFMLWGANAQKKKSLIDENKHLVLTSVHPSPLSFYHGFLECKHFSKANDFLIKNNIEPIDWSRLND